ncbi:MAG: hypothetical protein KatS3mg076_2533 [Candidatus Binatia bacterium]|nr:MAG: hypothetical protein KatS3mg076_2533 [Candidatus Binatia bacterium]
MPEVVGFVLAGAAGVAAGALLVFFFRRARTEASAVEVREELRAWREEAARAARESREELAERLREANRTLAETLDRIAELQRTQLDSMQRQIAELSRSNLSALESIRTTLDARVRELQEGNERKLEQIRGVVDERLQTTLEQRLTESFQLVGQHLEAVQSGLGEMRALAQGVGDLKRVLSNVKVRGTWAEVQLGALLGEILAPGQYEENVATKRGASERVEYAIRLPGRSGDGPVWLPVDSKFPQEDYLRLQEASERGDREAVARAAEALARAVRSAARDIRDKYLDPPDTTDFAVLFLATEGLFAEVVRQPGLVEELQRDCRVVVAGPTTLAALLSALRLGFQTLVIERRASEVWKVLASFRTEFRRFGKLLAKTRDDLHRASRRLEDTIKRGEAVERRLEEVAELPDERHPSAGDGPSAEEVVEPRPEFSGT